MIAIPSGTFWMGSYEDKSEQPIREVTVPAFYIGKYPITQEQYQAVIGINPSRFEGTKSPVEMVSWYDAVQFCQKLSQKTGKKYRLPSEAEWEYACCAKTKYRLPHESEREYVLRTAIRTKYCFGDYKVGDYEDRLKDYAWYNKNSDGRTYPVRMKKPNAWGLHHMHGSVLEWCSDRWHSNYQNAPTDGSSWEIGTDDKRVQRGGSWGSNAVDCRSAKR
ncbi:MAG: formylglycine-generating enzyme family protein, partial [Coleofasciculaceae cyanobacterium SM2_1_6]|nr:formylglycine-generating enzyme family protein [Coleofasciculaceae cyanobacterium SM2_1_6]